ncbi:MAG: hypothetical protein ACOY33_07530 [Pseudomonadota bacterium]
MMQIESLVFRLREAAAAAPAMPADLGAWRAGFRVQPDSFATAFEAGLAAGQLGFCFAGGYQAALRALVPALPVDAFAALLVTEGRQQRPEEIRTALQAQPGDRFRLDGEKSWVAGGPAATHLLVLARHGSDVDGRLRSALVLLSPQAAGVTLESRPANGFLDVVPHARARFDAVAVDAGMILPGDGWRDHARPFRTIEDIHVSTAIAAHLAVQGLRRDWPAPLLATLVAVLARLAQCAARAPGDPLTHLLLAGAEQELAQATAQTGALAAADDDAFARDWRANGMLLAMAAPARVKRLEKALAVLRR